MSDPNPTGIRFDVFLSHKGSEMPAARELKRRLTARGLVVWLDEDELPPGVPWVGLLDAGIRQSRSVAVLVGQDGLGPWHNEEAQAALVFAVQDGRPVIPVLLPGASVAPDLPSFLRIRTWVDFRQGFSEAGLDRLVWGIKGAKEPDRGARPEPAAPTPPPPSAPLPAARAHEPLDLGQVKNEFCARLGDDWTKLADRLQIPAPDQRPIAARHAGAEGRGVWEWLENRRQLVRLAPACRAVGRDDLADLLPADLGVGAGPPGFPR